MTTNLDALRELARRRLVAMRFPLDHCPHLPTDRQMAFLETVTIEALYGGAAGGGKSDALLMAAMQYVDEPRYAALLLRRTFRDLNQADALVPRSKEWLRGKAQWNQQSSRWTFDSGATLTFGYLEHADDVYQYQGAAFQFVGFDELTQFRETDYRYLFSRLRRLEGAAVPVRMRAASNPGGRGHDWVKRRFVDEATREPDAAFVPATLDDNRHLDRDEYRRSLEMLDPVTRAQLLGGDWSIGDDGILTYRWILDAETKEKPPAQLRPERYIGVDVGRSRDRTCLWTVERVGDVLWTSDVLVLQGVEFARQRAEIEQRVNLPSVVRCQIDKGFNPQLAEELEKRFPGKVVGVQLTQGRQGQFAAQLANAFEAKRIRIPHGDEDIRADFRLVKRVDIRAGVPVVQTDRDTTGHADRFWACALAVDGATWTKRTPAFARPVGFGVRR